MRAKHIKLENIRESGVGKEVRGFLLFCFVLFLVGRDGLNETEIEHLRSYQYVRYHHAKNTSAITREADLV